MKKLNLNKKDVIIMTRQKTITLKLTLAEVEELRKLWGIEHIVHKADFKQDANYDKCRRKPTTSVVG